VFLKVAADEPPASPARAAHVLGAVLGELSLDLNLAMLARHLLDAEPTAPWLREQAQALTQSITRGHARTLQALQHPALGAAIRTSASPALAGLAQLEIGDAPAGGPPLPALAQTLRSVSDAVGAIELAIT
jgi:hypothetical protein